MNRRSIAAVILVFWFGSLSWLVAREYVNPETDTPDETERSVPPGAEYHIVALAGGEIGFASTTVDTVPEGLLVDERLVLEIPTAGTLARSETRAVINLSNTLRLQSFETSQRSDAGRYTARGTLRGDTLEVGFERGDLRYATRIPVTGPVVFPSYLALHLSINGHLAPGNAVTVQTLDPLLLLTAQHEIEVLTDSILFVPDSAVFDSTTLRWTPVLYDTVHAWRVRDRVNGRETVSWIDDLGGIVGMESATGLTWSRTAFEIAFNNMRQRSRAEALAALGPGPHIVRRTIGADEVSRATQALEALEVRIRGPGVASLELDGDTQTFDGEVLRVTAPSDDATRADYRLPAQGPSLGPYTEATVLVRSSDPLVQAQARQVVDRTRNPRRAAERLATWVGENIALRASDGLPDALAVLEAGGGDVNDITLLYVAMARAVGLPARSAAGLLLVDDAFYYHAWPEVYLGGWVGIDPALGQFPADAAHIRFQLDGLARQVELISLIGPLTLDVQEARE